MKDRVDALWRKELLYLSLALMENLWFYAWLRLLLGSDLSPGVTGGITLMVLLGAMYLTRLLHYRKTALWIQRSSTLVLAVASSLLLVRMYSYAGYRTGDLTWLGSFAWEVSNVMQRISPALILFCAGLYLWVRGITLAQRDLGVESVGFSFRFGIIAFLWLFLVGILVPIADGTGQAFGYFLVGLVAVALARIESVSRSDLGIRSPFSLSWLGILAGSTVVVSAIGLAATALFSLRNVATAIGALEPVFALLARLVSPLAVAMMWLLELLINLLVRIFGGLFGESQEPGALGRIAEELQQFQQGQPAQGALLILLQVLKWAGLSLALVVALAIVALSVRRVRRVLEAEGTEQQATWDSNRDTEGARGQSRGPWQRLRDELQGQLARLRGEDYSLTSIRQIYASLVRLATVGGFPRREAETPYEYMATLRRAFDHSDEEIQVITEAYVRVHYGERSFPAAYVQDVRSAWLAIRARQAQRESQVQGA